MVWTVSGPLQWHSHWAIPPVPEKSFLKKLTTLTQNILLLILLYLMCMTQMVTETSIWIKETELKSSLCALLMKCASACRQSRVTNMLLGWVLQVTNTVACCLLAYRIVDSQMKVFMFWNKECFFGYQHFLLFCVNVPYFLSLFFFWRLCRLIPVSGYMDKDTVNMVLG